ncbi:MAG: glycosyltransferase family 4 protein [Phycisphaerae bacterium]
MSVRRVGMLLDGVIERYGLLSAVSNLVSAIDRERVELTGIFLARGEAEETLAPLCDRAIRLDVGSLPRLRATPRASRGWRGLGRLTGQVTAAARALRTVIVDYDLELLHAHYWHGFLIAGTAARWRGIGSIWHLHGGYEHTGWGGLLWEELGGALADRIICISRWVRGTLPPAWRERASVIYNGLPPERIRRRAATGAFRRRFAIPDDAVLIGAFGNIIERKGFDYFIDAAARVAAARHRVSFALVGDAIDGNTSSHRLAKELRERVAGHGLGERFVFTGRIPDAWQVMPDFDVIVLPTVPLPGDPTPDFGEGFGLVLAEAMSQGVPVIAADCGAAAELVDHDRTGLLVRPRSAAALAAGITRLAANSTLRRKLSEAGPDHVARRFDSMRMARTAENLYDEICEGSNNP